MVAPLVMYAVTKGAKQYKKGHSQKGAAASKSTVHRTVYEQAQVESLAPVALIGVLGIIGTIIATRSN